MIVQAIALSEHKAIALCLLQLLKIGTKDQLTAQDKLPEHLWKG